MEIPKFDETFIPLLELLKNGKVLKSRELIEEVKTTYEIKQIDEDFFDEQ